MKKPNFFLVGVGKSGTTSMHDYLAQHPDVFMSNPKEPFYFSPDIGVPWRISDFSKYLSLFEGASNEKCVGESSVDYMYSKVAAQNIKKFCSEAKIISILRNPIDVMYSLHGHLLYYAHEDILDFEEAIAAQEDRREGKRIPKNCKLPAYLLYLDYVKYSSQLKRYIDLFGYENILVILFDDFVKNTAITYRKTLEFLEVAPNFDADFDIKNAAKPLPNLALRSFLFKYPALKAPIQRLFPRKKIEWVRDNLVGKLTQRQRPKTIPPLVRARLVEKLKPEIQELSNLIDIDLRHWLN